MKVIVAYGRLFLYKYLQTSVYAYSLLLEILLIRISHHGNCIFMWVLCLGS
jgi:hypothetical protein